jgi:hypothetical protein
MLIPCSLKHEFLCIGKTPKFQTRVLGIISWLYGVATQSHSLFLTLRRTEKAASEHKTTETPSFHPNDD